MTIRYNGWSDFDDKLLRLKEVLDHLQISKSTWWAKIKAGIYPEPVYIAPRCPRWKASDILHLMEHGYSKSQQNGIGSVSPKRLV